MVRRRRWLNGLGPGVGLLGAWLWTGDGDYRGYPAVRGVTIAQSACRAGGIDTYSTFSLFPWVPVVPFCRYSSVLRGADGAKRSVISVPGPQISPTNK